MAAFRDSVLEKWFDPTPSPHFTHAGASATAYPFLLGSDLESRFACAMAAALTEACSSRKYLPLFDQECVWARPPLQAADRALVNRAAIWKERASRPSGFDPSRG